MRASGLTAAAVAFAATPIAVMGVGGVAGATEERPTAIASRPLIMQLPFPCRQVWNGDSNNSSAHRRPRNGEIDFNRRNDLGDTVVAAEAGTVVTSAHQGRANGFGNLVVIGHGQGYYTYYAHLQRRSVRAGQAVRQGQAIGTVGNTSKPGNPITPHLHYEIRNPRRGYPQNIRRAFFNRRLFGYTNQTLRSNNC